VCLHGCSLTIIRCSSLSFHTTRVTRYKYAEFCWRCPLLAVSVYKTVRCPYVCPSVCLSVPSIDQQQRHAAVLPLGRGRKHRSTAAGATGYRSISARRTPSMLWSEEDRRRHVVLISTSCAILSMIFNLQDVYFRCDHWHLKRYLSNVPSLKDWKDSSLKGSSSNAWCWIQRKLQQSYYRSFHCGSVLGIHVNCSIVVDSQLSSKISSEVRWCNVSSTRVRTPSPPSRLSFCSVSSSTSFGSSRWSSEPTSVNARSHCHTASGCTNRDELHVT